jgi:glycosyltransferase involved in cell wall biosynthesis
MRIALIVTGGVDRSGRERVIPVLLSFIERLAAQHAVTVYALRYHGTPCTYSLFGATVRDLGRPSGLAAQCLALIRALRQDGPFDILHGFWAKPPGLLASIAGRWLRTPTVVTIDSGEFVRLPEVGYGLQRRRRDRFAVNLTLRLATRLTVCTEYMARLARAHGVDPLIAPMGVDSRRFSPADPPAGPPWRLLHVASLNPVKDQPTLLHAFALLRRREPDVHLDIVGEDTLGGAMHDLTRRLGLEDAVTFHGFRSSDELVDFYRRAHLLVSSSRHEAAGVVSLEAAACRVATVGSAVGYVADWSPDRALGVPPANAEALADGIAALLWDRVRRDRIADAARTWAVAHDADWTANYFERLYREMARSRAEAEPFRAGLCADCEFARRVESARGSAFCLCERSASDPAFPKYPRLPVLHCLGHRPRRTGDARS